MNKKKLIISTLIVEVTVAMLLVWFSYKYVRNNLEDDLQLQMLSIAKFAAARIHTSDIKKITEVNDPYFLEIKEDLRLIEQTYGLREGLAYIVELHNSKPVFSVMTNAIAFRGHHYPDEVVGQIHDAFRGKEVTSDLYTDRNGEFISVLVPLWDQGDVVAVLEIDVTGEAYRAELQRKLSPFLTGLIIIWSIPFGFIFLVLLKLYKSNEIQLKAQAEAHQARMLAIEEKERFDREILAKQVESERTRNQALDEQRRRFFAMVVHDLRSPITTLSLMMETIKRELKPDIAALYGPKFDREFSYIKLLVEDIATLNSLQFSGFKPKYEKFDAKMLLDDLVGRLKAKAAVKHIAFKVIGRDTTIEADKLQVERVFNNLLGNALSHSADNTEVLVNTAVLADKFIVRITNTPSYLLKPSELDQIFEPFVKYDPRGKSDDSGANSGLGLAITKAILETHHGRIFATLNENGSISFTSEIPLKAVLEQAKAA